jgi:hypothetical protein
MWIRFHRFKYPRNLYFHKGRKTNEETHHLTTGSICHTVELDDSDDDICDYCKSIIANMGFLPYFT